MEYRAQGPIAGHGRRESPAAGRVVFKGKSIGFVEGTLRDDDGKMIAIASATVRIVSPQPEKESP